MLAQPFARTNSTQERRHKLEGNRPLRLWSHPNTSSPPAYVFASEQEWSLEWNAHTWMLFQTAMSTVMT